MLATPKNHRFKSDLYLENRKKRQIYGVKSVKSCSPKADTIFFYFLLVDGLLR
jgi:hypothetical protein